VAKLAGFWLVLNYKCNNRCTHCYAETTHFEDVAMPFKLASDAIELMAENGTPECLLIGGEPTLYEKLPAVVEKGSSLGLKMQLVTNARKLSDRDYLHDLVSRGLTSVNASICGSSQEKHDRIAKARSFSETVKAIDNCLKIGLPLYVAMTVTKLNIDDVKATAVFLESIGVKSIGFNLCIPSIGPDGSSAKFTPHPQELAEMLDRNYFELKALKARVKFNQTIPFCLLGKEVLADLEENKTLCQSCQCHMFDGNRLVFDPRGYLLPCTHWVDLYIDKIWTKETGFAHRDHFLDYWTDSNCNPERFREKLWVYPSQKCQECEYWGPCVGGCPLFRTSFEPDTYIKKALTA
jgi:radical SAM protein with 4Fe4S-binding SPASM domain